MSSGRSGDSVPGEARRNNGHSYRERLGADSKGRTLLAYLSARYHHASEAEWRARIEAGQVLIDELPTTASRTLAPGENLVWNRPPWQEPPAASSFGLLYKDDDVLAVAKPRGLPTMPGAGYLQQTLLFRVNTAFPEASPLHRLGRGTSGVVLFSRSRASRRRWTREWPRVAREYRALVDGAFAPGEKELTFPIGYVPHPVLGRVAAAAPRGKPAHTHVELVERRPSSSLVKITITTGRTHQIRIHLAAAGYPLVGDPLYPVGGIPVPGDATLPGETGYWLHAHRLALDGFSVTCAPPPVLRGKGE